jgi:hypothetical protein
MIWDHSQVYKQGSNNYSNILFCTISEEFERTYKDQRAGTQIEPAATSK